MSAQPVDVLAELLARQTPEFGVENVKHATDCREWLMANGAAVAELIEADKEYDAARNDVCKAAQTRGRHSSEAVSARHKLGNAIARRAAALARVQGGAA